MNFQLSIDIPALIPRIQYESKILLIGSCFTEHMTKFLSRHKFSTMENSHGILFNPISVCKALQDVIEHKVYQTEDLFYLDEYWHSWFHHSDFSDMKAEKAVEKINASIESQHQFLKEADYVFITLGSAFAYRLIDQDIFVSNNHRAPSQWFEKVLLEIEDIKTSLTQLHTNLLALNPKLKLVYTISPVRHSRDGIIQNNRSKARLIEAIHSLPGTYYFPAYELVIDILRDYRFYDLDLVHPNYQATAFVWEHFVEYCIDPSCYSLMKKMDQIYKAKHHLSKNTESEAHKKFYREHHQLCADLQSQYPFLDLNEEIKLFANH